MKGGEHMHGSHCNYWRCANRIGLFLAILFVICFSWFYIHPVEPDLHLRMLRLSFFGFTDMNVSSFVLGAIQSYIWAYIGVGVWQLVGCCFKAGQCDSSRKA
jgi:hypothetical protein